MRPIVYPSSTWDMVECFYGSNKLWWPRNVERSTFSWRIFKTCWSSISLDIMTPPFYEIMF